MECPQASLVLRGQVWDSYHLARDNLPSYLVVGASLQSKLHKLNVETCQVLVPRVPRAAGYGPTNLDTVWFPPVENGWGTKYPIPDMAPTLLVEGERPPT
jgi:hypothetical protein